MQKPTNPMQEDWEKELEERFMGFHFEFDERQEHDKSTAELRDWTKLFIRQLLASQKDQIREKIENIKYKEVKEGENITRMIEAKPWRPEEAINQWIYNQALDDVVKCLAQEIL